MERRHARWLLRLGAIALVASGCNLSRNISSDVLLRVYNEGGVDSHPDPALDPHAIALERATMTARRTLARAFFSQGAAPHQQSPGDTRLTNAAFWFQSLPVRTAALELLHGLAGRQNGKTKPTGATSPGQTAQQGAPSTGIGLGDRDDEEQARAFRKAAILAMKLDADGLENRGGSNAAGPALPVCADRNGGMSAVGKQVADAAQFLTGVELAVRAVAQLVVEGLLTEDQAREGVGAAMTQTAAYIESRRWQKSARNPTLGMSIKGGGSSGPYSAGVAWRMLTLLQKGTTPGGEERRIAISSGTSAGAVVAAAVDLFHTETCVIDREATGFRRQYEISGDVAQGWKCREYARRLMATMFTCTNQDSLYCIDRQALWNLAGDQKGLMNFVGLRSLMARHVLPEALTNSSELLLTTVDFRWGDLYLQSDQDPSTVPIVPRAPKASWQAASYLHRNIEASFVLPFIAHPVDALWIQNARRVGVYLDGGIKSELPVLALQERGIERALVIGSAPTRITPVAPQENAAMTAARYLDVSLSAVTSAEWDAVVPYAKYLETKVEDSCEAIFDHHQVPLDANARLFCKSEYARACGDAKAPSRRFDTFGLFRPESVDPSFGYTFARDEMRRLFNAGAEAVRTHCREAATFLGLDPPDEVLDVWCNETPITEEGLCMQSTAKASACE